MTEIELPQNGKPIVPPRLGFVVEELGLDMVEDLKSLKGGRKRKTPGLATWGSYFVSVSAGWLLPADSRWLT
ncbi:hypothetical protein [Rhizobium sp. YTU87027]|uniref:hypothetical protein n=1 Tax=Rhizobium sp. YTU87027 TaxID=3417741 RepID=UPI003D68B7F0